MRCPLHPGDENGIYSFTKMNKSTGKLELVHQGRDLDMTITDLSDAGIYCCKPHCANNTKSCCVNIQGIYNIIMQTGFGKSSLIVQKLNTSIRCLSQIQSYIMYKSSLFTQDWFFYTVQSEIAFHMTEVAYIHQKYTASCTIRSSPTANLYIYTRGCRFQRTISLIDEDTTEAIIVISNISQECRNITCSTNTFQKSKTISK